MLWIVRKCCALSEHSYEPLHELCRKGKNKQCVIKDGNHAEDRSVLTTVMCTLLVNLRYLLCRHARGCAQGRLGKIGEGTKCMPFAWFARTGLRERRNAKLPDCLLFGLPLVQCLEGLEYCQSARLHVRAPFCRHLSPFASDCWLRLLLWAAHQSLGGTIHNAGVFLIFRANFFLASEACELSGRSVGNNMLYTDCCLNQRKTKKKIRPNRLLFSTQNSQKKWHLLIGFLLYCVWVEHLPDSVKIGWKSSSSVATPNQTASFCSNECYHAPSRWTSVLPCREAAEELMGAWRKFFRSSMHGKNARCKERAVVCSSVFCAQFW